MGRFTRRQAIDRRRRRRAKYKRLKAKISKAKGTHDIESIMNKIYKVHPHYPLQEK